MGLEVVLCVGDLVIVYGIMVVINVVLEGKGVCIVLVINEGFEDVLLIGC